MQSSRTPALLAKELLAPIDLQECENHGRTGVIGKPLPNSKVCACCGLKYQKQVISTAFELDEIYYLGSGPALYFSFIKSCVVITLITALSFSVATLYFNYRSNSCIALSRLKCSESIWLKLSVANKLGADTSLIQLQSYMVNATTVLMFILFQISRKRMRDIQIEADMKLTPNDYAVMLRLPFKTFTEADVRACIAAWFEGELRQKLPQKSKLLFKCKKEFPIQKVVISYNMEQYEQLQKEREDLEYDIKANANKPNPKFNLQTATNRVKQIQQLIAEKKLGCNSKCVVVFRYPEQRNYILSRTEKTVIRFIFPCCYNQLKMRGYPVTVTRVPLPSEIIWEHHHVPYKKKFWWRLGTRFFCLVVIVAGEAAVFALLYAWFRYVRNKSSDFENYVSPIISLSISVVNFLIYKVLTKVSKYEFRPTTLQEMVSITTKITFSVFLNSGIMLMLAYFILDMQSIWVYNGFVETISYSYMFSMVLPHISKYADPQLLFGWYYRRSVPKQEHVTQVEANQAFERPQIHLYERYAWMVNMVWWSSVFAPMVPLSYPCVFFSLFIHYWQEKLNYISFFREPRPFGSYLNLEIFGLLELAPLFLGLGNIALDFVLAEVKGTKIEVAVVLFDLVGVGVGLLIFILPSETLSRLVQILLCCGNQKVSLNFDYQATASQFLTTYERENPVYREQILVNIRKTYGAELDAEQHEMAKSLSSSLRKQSGAVVHPLKLVQQQSSRDFEDDDLGENYKERIVREPMRTKNALGKKYVQKPPPLYNTQNVELEMANFSQVFQGMSPLQKQKIINKVSQKIDRINK